MKDKYLRELVKLEGKKDTEIAELKKKVGDANAQGFKEAKGLYILQCEGAKDLFFKCGWRSAAEQLGYGPETEVYNAPQYFIPASLAEYAASVQEQFLQDSDDEDEENEQAVTPVVNEQVNNQLARLEATVEDLTVEPSIDIVLPVATETDAPSATGVQVDIDAEIEDLFSWFCTFSFFCYFFTLVTRLRPLLCICILMNENFHELLLWLICMLTLPTFISVFAAQTNYDYQPTTT